MHEQPRQHITRNEEDLPGHRAEVNVRKQHPAQQRGVPIGGPSVRRPALSSGSTVHLFQLDANINQGDFNGVMCGTGWSEIV